MPAKYKSEINELARTLSAAASKLDALASDESHAYSEYYIHKAMNIAYKELRLIATLLRSIGGEKQFNRTALRAMIRHGELDVQKPQSWQVYLESH